VRCPRHRPGRYRSSCSANKQAPCEGVAQSQKRGTVARADRLQTGYPMTMQHAEINGINIAYDTHGSGPPLVLIMGYRLNSHAWPLGFIETLAERFTVVF